MVFNHFIKCQVCGSVTRIRLQVGWQKEHPVVVTCGECGTSLFGRVQIGQDKPGLMFEFDNADVSDQETADYVVECSGEFPTKKQCSVAEAENILITPFIRMVNSMKDDDGFYKFCKTVSHLKETENKWKDYERIFTLFQNNSEYLIQEIKKKFSGEYFQCRDEFEVLRAVHMMEVFGFYLPLKEEILDPFSLSNNILKMDHLQMEKFIDYLNSHEGYHLYELQSLIYKLYAEFIEIYQALIPALSMQYCREDTFDYKSDGSTTSAFDTVKQFYLNVYETLGNLLIIPIALNNIKYRLDFNLMNPIEKNVLSLDDFIGLTKGKRYQYCLKEEAYTDLVGVVVNSQLRNAIGHNDVEYDTVQQLITYLPNPKDRTKRKTKYLLEFENDALKMFQGILVVSEYLYHLRKFSLILEGKEPIKPKTTIKKLSKIGRNDPCPCGSGKKYKVCHGKGD